MYAGLKVFRMAYALAAHAGERQAVIAQNIANADTPGYRAKDIQSFAEAWRTQPASGFDAASLRSEVARDVDMDPNRNTVSLELEMMKSVEVRQEHDRALAIYRSALNILRTSLGRG